MPAESEADLDSFFETDDFGVVVRTPKGTFQAIHDKAFAESFAGAAGIESNEPILTCKTAAITELGLEKGDELDVAGELYKFLRHEPDGTGQSVILMTR